MSCILACLNSCSVHVFMVRFLMSTIFCVLASSLGVNLYSPKSCMTLLWSSDLPCTGLLCREMVGEVPLDRHLLGNAGQAVGQRRPVIPGGAIVYLSLFLCREQEAAHACLVLSCHIFCGLSRLCCHSPFSLCRLSGPKGLSCRCCFCGA